MHGGETVGHTGHTGHELVQEHDGGWMRCNRCGGCLQVAWYSPQVALVLRSDASLVEEKRKTEEAVYNHFFALLGRWNGSPRAVVMAKNHRGKRCHFPF